MWTEINLLFLTITVLVAGLSIGWPRKREELYYVQVEVDFERSMEQVWLE